MKKFEIILSAMHLENFDIVEKSRIESDVLIINQCNDNKEITMGYAFGTAKMICTSDRGLSRSRNLALKQSQAEYVLICDDDEVFESGYADKIINSFDENPDYDILAFMVDYRNKRYSSKSKDINIFSSLKISSVQIAIRRSKLIESGVLFDVNFGSGSSVSMGEENIFLIDCLKAGLKIKFIPILISKVMPGESQWFKGYTHKYFSDKGKAVKRMFGIPLNWIYCFYLSVRMYPLYKEEMKYYDALRLMLHPNN